MLAGSGVCGVIHRAAGRELAEYGKRFAPLGLGQAVVTPGFNLQNRLIIHVHGPKYLFDQEPAQYLAECVHNALKLADENQVKRIAFPAISTGIYGYPMAEATHVLVNAVYELMSSLNHVNEIRFVVTSPEVQCGFNQEILACLS